MTASLKPRLRIVRGERIVMGPGKADLLEAIGRLRTLRGAAKELGMSYMRAWSLVKTMNHGFQTPLVSARRGGTGHGGASLTPAGRAALALYRTMEKKSLKAAGPEWRRLRRLMKP